MSERNYYVICEDNCRFPAMTKEQILAAIAEATGNTPTDVDSAFITKIKELHNNVAVTFWVGTTAEYNAIVAADQVVENCFYITTDETLADDVDAAIEAMRAEVDALNATVAPLAYDSGWQDIKRKAKASLGETTYIIGKYRVIGKIVYVNIEYDYYSFLEATATSDTIVLPVLLDNPPATGINGNEYAFVAIEDRDTAPLYTFRSVSIGHYTTNLTIANISLDGGYIMTRISFSAPYKGMNPDYTL